MATGDLKNNLKKLHLELRRIRLPQHLQNNDGFASGDAKSYLPVYEYLFDWYSPAVTQYINEHNFKLLPYQDDKNKFVEAMYLILREVFNWKPSLTIAQFLSGGFVEHKVIMCTEISRRIREKHYELEMKGTEKKLVTHGGIRMTIKNVPANFTNGKIDNKNNVGDGSTMNGFKSNLNDPQLIMDMYQKIQNCCAEIKEMKNDIATCQTKLQELSEKMNLLEVESSHDSSEQNGSTYKL